MPDSQEPRDRKLIASAALIGLIVIAGLLVVIVRLAGGNDDNNDPTAQPTSSATPSKSGGSSSACGLPDGSQDVPAAAPDAQWYFKAKIAVPKSAVFGPAEGASEGSVARCFAHSPTGALFAASTIAAETSSFSPVAKDAILAHIVAGELRDEMIQTLDPAPGPLTQIVGFKFEDHTPDRATITLATRIVDGPNAGAVGATPMTLVWVDGDWKQEIQPGAPTAVITSLDGFVQWSGIS
jgi:hypothetical protein